MTALIIGFLASRLLAADPTNLNYLPGAEPIDVERAVARIATLEADLAAKNAELEKAIDALVVEESRVLDTAKDGDAGSGKESKAFADRKLGNTVNRKQGIEQTVQKLQQELKLIQDQIAVQKSYVEYAKTKTKKISPVAHQAISRVAEQVRDVPEKSLAQRMLKFLESSGRGMRVIKPLGFVPALIGVLSLQKQQAASSAQGINSAQ